MTDRKPEIQPDRSDCMSGDAEPILLYNDDAKGVKVHTSLIRHMGSCDRFT